MSALGGVGLFLIGMLLLTGGLKALAGRRMRAILAGFTSTPLSGAATGAMTTAVIQSSSATTVAAVGFVASGLLTFPQALGIIFGANVGTTMTGWIVAILGFKLDLGQIALPFVFLGAVLSLASKGRFTHLGQALAGFCLIFIGIDQMQSGLEAFRGVVTPTDFPPDSLFGRLQMVGFGILITLVTQSSSAGVATALAALGAGAINFPQAAALVIGMDVGTTFTAALATLGGGTMARRTGYAHVIYNFLTGLMAFMLLGPFQTFLAPFIGGGDPQIGLVAFHSSFNVLGVLLILPLAGPFAHLIEFLVPERRTDLSKDLDPLLLRDPATAIQLANITVTKISSASVACLSARLAGTSAETPDNNQISLMSALSDTRDYLDKMELPMSETLLIHEKASALHVLDHLERLLYRCDQDERLAALRRDHRLRRLTGLLLEMIARPPNPACAPRLDKLRGILRRQREIRRNSLINAVAAGRLSSEDVGNKLDALRWLHRVTYHLWRICLHLEALTPSSNTIVPQSDEARIEIEQD